MTCNSPRERAGLNIFAAFIVPSLSPVPTSLCTSSMKSMMLPRFLISSTSDFTRLSNCPRNCVPATSDVRSSRYSSLPSRRNGTSPETSLCAIPSAIAVLPTPGSPIRQGLFFERRDKIWSTRSISLSRPIIRSSFPAFALSVRFSQNVFKNLRFFAFLRSSALRLRSSAFLASSLLSEPLPCALFAGASKKRWKNAGIVPPCLKPSTESSSS